MSGNVSLVSFNGLALNPDKTDVIVFGTHRCARTDEVLESVNVADSLVKPTDKIKLLGVTLDKKLALNTNVGAVCMAAYLHIRAVSHIRIVLTDDTAKNVGCALVSSRLDYVNSLLYGTSDTDIAKL